MPSYCAVIGCSNDQKSGKRFFSIPAVRTREGPATQELLQRRRLMWLKAINRKGLDFNTVKPYHNVCSDHFISGKPAYEQYETDPDWVPSVQMGHYSHRDVASRHGRAGGRRKKEKDIATADSLLELKPFALVKHEPHGGSEEESGAASHDKGYKEVEENLEMLAGGLDPACAASSHFETQTERPEMNVPSDSKLSDSYGLNQSCFGERVTPVMMFSRADLLASKCNQVEKSPTTSSVSQPCMQISIGEASDSDHTTSDSSDEDGKANTNDKQTVSPAQYKASDVLGVNPNSFVWSRYVENHQAPGTSFSSVVAQQDKDGRIPPHPEENSAVKSCESTQAVSQSLDTPSVDRFKSRISLHPLLPSPVARTNGLPVASFAQELVKVHTSKTTTMVRKAARKVSSPLLNYSGPVVLQPLPMKAFEPGSSPLYLISQGTISDFQTGECDARPQKFSNTDELARHKCLNQNPYYHPCIACGSIFTSTKKLKQHMRQHMILNLTVFACDVCGRLFENPKKLKRHQKSHFVIYKCDLCRMEFLKMSNLLYHKAEAHSKKPDYFCRFCNTTFQKLHNLNRHLKSRGESGCHKNQSRRDKTYQCEVCGKVFKWLSGFRNHMKKHRGKTRPSVCETCGKTCNSADDLTGHLLTHEGPPPCKCDPCNKGYFSACNLKNPKKDKHRVDPNEASCGKA